MKELQKREAELNKNNQERIKIVEKGGLKIKKHFMCKKSIQKLKCEQKTCPLCSKSEFVDISSEEVKIACNTNNIGYRWRCMTCNEKDTVKVYEGETGWSARLRGRSTSDSLRKI